MLELIIKNSNFILMVDSYKADHYEELPPNVEYTYVSIVPRKPSKYATKIVAMGQSFVANMLSKAGVMVLRSLLNMLPGGSTGLAGLQGSMLPMLAMMGDGDNESSLSQMMPLMLMSQMGMMTGGAPTDGSAPVANPMAQMLPMMIMMKLMGGKNGGGNFFD